MSLPSLPRALAALVAASLWVAGAPAALAGTSRISDEQLYQAGMATLPAEAKVGRLYLAGEPSQGLALYRALAREGDAATAFVLGNRVWTLEPELSMQWHQQALAWSGGDPQVRVQMGLHHMRREQCEEAIVEFDAADEAGLLTGAMPAMAAYCHFKLGRYATAYALVARARLQGNHTRFESLLREVWIERARASVHAHGVESLRAGKPVDVDRVLAGTFSIGDQNQLLATLALIDAVPDGVEGDLSHLRCLRPAYEAERVASQAANSFLFEPDAALVAQWKQALEACGLVLGDGRLPAGRSLALELLGRAWSMGLDEPARTLASQREHLWTRATGAEGSRTALEVLSEIQARAGDVAGLSGTAELGWRRYRLPDLAARRLELAVAEGEVAPEALAALAREALADFPDHAGVLRLALAHGQLDAAARNQALIAQVLAEYHHPSAKDARGRASATHLWAALRELQPQLAPDARIDGDWPR